MLLPSKRSLLYAASAEDLQPLLPGLPDHLAQLCLSSVPPSLLFSVCRSWRRLIYSPSFPPFLCLYALLSKNDRTPRSDDVADDPIGFFIYDPIAGSWSRLPESPPDSPIRRIIVSHPYFLSRQIPIQSVAAGGRLVLLAASDDRLLPALHRPFVFHPASRRWSTGPPISTPRRWCAAGSDSGAVYLVSGVGSAYRSEVARSAERWDLRSGNWEALAPLRDGRFCREAVEAVGAAGKLWMVNVRGRGAKEGAVYDICRDQWEEMPSGIMAGWTGPAASDDEGSGVIYVVDEWTGEVRAYECEEDSWRLVAPAEEARKGAVAVSASRGKVCVAVSGGHAVEVFDVRFPGRKWVVELPSGTSVIDLHVLPRVSECEF